MCKILDHIIEGGGHFGVNCKQRNNIATVIYNQPLEGCHLQMIQAESEPFHAG